MIDKNRIKENLISFSFPRLSGTNEEKKASQMAKEKIEELNLKPQIQEFMFSTFYSRIYSKLGFVSISISLLIFYLNIESIFFVFAVLTLFIIMLFSFRITRKPHKIKIGRVLNSQNIYAKLPPKSNTQDLPDNHILFFCHLDSKGQRINILTRIKIIRMWLYTTIMIPIIIILKNYIFVDFEFILYLIGAFPMGANLVAACILLMNTTDNNSYGAIDNASGIAIVLELLNFYSEYENRLENHSTWFVFTGAEETGTMGIRVFNEIIKKFDRKNTIIINFDAIGQSVCVFASKNTRENNAAFFNLLINKGIKSNVIKDIRYRTLGAHSDGYFLKTQKFMGAGFGDLLTYDYVHSELDTPDKVNFCILEKLCSLITSVLIDYDEMK